MTISFEIPTKPAGQPRARVGVIGGHGRAFKSKKAHALEADVLAFAAPVAPDVRFDNDSGSSSTTVPPPSKTSLVDLFAGVFEREQLRVGAEKRLREHLRERYGEEDLGRYALEASVAVVREARRRIDRDGGGALPALVNHIVRSRGRVRIHALAANAWAADARATAERRSAPAIAERSGQRMGGAIDPFALLELLGVAA